MNQSFLNKLLIATLSVISLVMFMVPYSLIFCSESESSEIDGWKSTYVYDDIILAIIYLPFIVLWFTSLFLKNMSIKRILKGILGILSILYLVIAFLNLTMVAQDVIPYIGVYLSVLIFPLFLGYQMSSRKTSRES